MVVAVLAMSKWLYEDVPMIIIVATTTILVFVLVTIVHVYVEHAT